MRLSTNNMPLSKSPNVYVAYWGFPSLSLGYVGSKSCHHEGWIYQTSIFNFPWNILTFTRQLGYHIFPCSWSKKIKVQKYKTFFFSENNRIEFMAQTSLQYNWNKWIQIYFVALQCLHRPFDYSLKNTRFQKFFNIDNRTDIIAAQ